MRPRKKPYTVIGVRRLKCFRCGSPAEAQWQICSDGNVYRPICVACDIALNEVVLRFMRFRDWRSKIRAYRQRLFPALNKECPPCPRPSPPLS